MKLIKSYAMSFNKRYIGTYSSNRATIAGSNMEKRVHLKVDADNLTLREVMDKLEEIQAENPDLDVFFDGDTKSICSRPRSKTE